MFHVEHSNAIELPYKFELRPYQVALYDAFFKHNKKRIITIWHRRAGKDKSYFNLCVAAAFKRKGTYYYLFPTQKQAREVIWEGMDKNGISFLDHIPPQLILRKNKTNMLIEFTNGSKFQLGGSDNFNKLMGSNPVGIVFSEYSLQNPLAWHYLRPILIENGGWAAFNFTPRGQNHAFDLYNLSINNDEWFSELLTINDTRDRKGERIITPEIIEQERKDGMSDSLIEQEFFCSFTAAIDGAYYAHEIKEAFDRGRICNFPLDSRLPVYTFWDLGMRDATAIWFMQPFQSELRLINYYENNGKSLQWYKNYMDDFRDKNNLTYGGHWAPHDIQVSDLSTGKSRLEIARELGLRFNVVPHLGKFAITEGIYAVRSLFNRFWFHETNCHFGLNALKNYHEENGKPEHDWSSHAADAFRYLAIAWRDSMNNNKEHRGPIKRQAW
jgi:hypothetical protein